MITAKEARKLTATKITNVDVSIKQIEIHIKVHCEKGMRHLYFRLESYNDVIPVTDILVKNGYTVSVSDKGLNELRINW